MNSAAHDLSTWANELNPSKDDLFLAERSLIDTLGVTLAARRHEIGNILAGFDDATRWATLGHVLDFDDLHLGSTAHVSVVCVMATLAAGGDERAYLAGAGVMARLGSILGWSHYAAGWHATCTAGAPAAAVAASVARGLSREQTATAIALAIPAAGGVQRAFGTDAKSLQVGFAVSAGLRASHLASLGATADPLAVEEWIQLVGGGSSDLDLNGESIPGGLAIKLFPCCYALQRPIEAMRTLANDGVSAVNVKSIHVVTPKATVQPLIHHHPNTALEAKFSLEYGLAVALLDDYPGLASFTDDAVRRDQVQELIGLSELSFADSEPAVSLLSGEVEIEVKTSTGKTKHASLAIPSGAPDNPPNAHALAAKLADCGADVPSLLSGITWGSAPELLRQEFPSASRPRV